jgi:5-(carboxyamino)imidazole ribonucleotide mutase
MKKVAILMGSQSDWQVMKRAVPVLLQLQIPYDVHVASAHRTPDAVADIAQHAKEDGYGVLIAGAGLAAHLAGALAANTILPVIGVPLSSSTQLLGGMDAVLSTLQMPTGIPVATVALDNAANAAVLASQILALTDSKLAERVIAYRSDLRLAALERDNALQELLHTEFPE